MDKKRMEEKASQHAINVFPVNWGNAQLHGVNRANAAASYSVGYTEGYADAEQQVKGLREVVTAAEKYLTSCGLENVEKCEPEFQMLMSFREALREPSAGKGEV